MCVGKCTVKGGAVRPRVSTHIATQPSAADWEALTLATCRSQVAHADQTPEIHWLCLCSLAATVKVLSALTAALLDTEACFSSTGCSGQGLQFTWTTWQLPGCRGRACSWRRHGSD